MEHTNLIKISILIIAQNAEKTIRRCLESTTSFSEVIVIDGGSTDQTQNICAQFPNVCFFSNPWPGFIPQRNFSIKKASNEWCLMIDSDEAFSDELISYLKNLKLDQLDKKLYSIMRTEYFEHIEVEHGFGRSNFQERLFKKSNVIYSGGNHHNHLIDGVLSTSDHPEVGFFPEKLRIYHNPSYTLDEMMMKLSRFSVLIANEKYERGRRTNAFTVVITFTGTFLQIYLKSIRAGKVGFIMAMMEALHRTMVKLYIYNIQHFKDGKIDHSYQSKKLG